MSSGPLACFITFRCYGTWLYGDARGSMDFRHRDRGEPPLPRDDLGAAFERREMSGPPALLGPCERPIVAEAITEACAYRSRQLIALDVRTNHVHVAVSAPSRPEQMMNVLKARATWLLRDRGLCTSGRRVWSRHGSTRYLWSEDEVASACRYVIEGQEQLGEL